MGIPDMEKVSTLSELIAEVPDDADEIGALARRATSYVMSFEWTSEVIAIFAGIVVPEIIGVFLLNIRPARPEVDDWLWVVVGDVPPAYLVTDDCPNPATALDGYIGEMEQWVAAVRNGEPVDELIPVNVPPTKEFADMLESRLTLLRADLLSQYGHDLAE